METPVYICFVALFLKILLQSLFFGFLLNQGGAGNSVEQTSGYLLFKTATSQQTNKQERPTSNEGRCRDE